MSTTAREPWAGTVQGLRSAGGARIIEPRQPGPLNRVTELWTYRRLISFFGWNMVRKSYARTVLGWLWVPLRPALTVASQILLFGGILRVASDGVPYPIFLIAGMSVWHYFERLVFFATRSLELSRRYLRRLYLPRLVPLLASHWPAGIAFFLYAVMWVIAVVYFVFRDGMLYAHLGPRVALVLAALGLTSLVAISIGFFTSVLGAQTRDTRFFLRYVLGLWLYVTPVVYPLSTMPAGLRPIATYNPLTAPVELMRSAAIGTGGPQTASLLTTLGFALVVGCLGAIFFTRSESASLDNL